MDLAQRRLIYAEIEAYRKRPLLVYATSTRRGAIGSLAGDAVRELTDQIDSISAGDSIDVLIHSVGGDGLTAWKLMSVLRERFTDVEVLVPFMAFSAATIFALGANRIHMHPHASLGPIDPQITVVGPDGKQTFFSYEDLGAFLRFLKREAHITEQEHLAAIVEKLFSAIPPIVIGGAQRASELATAVGERLLLLHMKDPGERVNAAKVAENLNKSFYAHGDAVSRSRALELGLKIAPRDHTLEGLMWKAFLGLEAYMQFRVPFNTLSHFMADPAAKATLAPVAPLALPPNLPQAVLNQIHQQLASQALTPKPGVEVPIKLVYAVVESVRGASAFIASGRITAWRTANNEIKVSSLSEDAKWTSV